MPVPTGSVVLTGLLLVLTGCGAPAPAGPPTAARFDYQLGEPYPPADGVTVVVRDWADGEPLPGGWSVCYVNAFQTQPDDPDGPARRDSRSSWPDDLLLAELGEDPDWPGELLVDLSSEDRRARAAAWLEPVLDVCADKGFDAVELDNLDSWTRFEDTDRAGRVPFGRAEALDHATRLTTAAHRRGLAVAQKNTPQLTPAEVEAVGFDLVVAEQCGRYDECDAYTALHGDAVLDVEYDDDGFARACDVLGSGAAVVRRDVDLAGPGDPGHVARWCGISP